MTDSVEPSQEIVVLPREPLKLDRLSLFDIEKLSSNAARSRYFSDASTGAQAAVKMVWGQELGIPPMASLSGIHMVKGKPNLHYATIGALLKNRGYKVVPLEWDDQHCLLEWNGPNPDFQDYVKLHGKPPDPQPPVGVPVVPRYENLGTTSWSLEEARRAGVVKDQSPWITYPKVMMYARALSIGAKIYAPEIFSGAIYTEDELDDPRFDAESTATEVPTISVPQDIPTPTVTAQPAQPTEQLASPNQRGALWKRAMDRGMTRPDFERLIRETFDVPSLDRLPASSIPAANAAIDQHQPSPSADGESPVQGSPEAGGESPPPASTELTLEPERPVERCLVEECPFEAAGRGLCHGHLEELRARGTLTFFRDHPETQPPSEETT